MPHLEEGLLHELLDGEIPSTDLPPIQAHLAGCAECRARLEEARELAAEADGLIETIELSEPDAPRGAVIPSRARAPRWGRDLAWAATVVLAVGAGYVARGSGPASLPRREDVVAAPGLEPGGFAVAPADRAANQEREAAAERPTETARTGNLPSPQASRPAAPAAGSGPAKPVATAAAEGKAAGAAPDASKDGSDSALRKRTLRDTAFRLEERVTTSVAEPTPPPMAPGAKAALAPSARQSLAARANEVQLDQVGNLSRGARREAAPEAISFPDALERLGGGLRLIEGLVPLRLEVLEPDVRVVYPIAGGELILAQRLVDGRISYRLVAPASFPVDSLERLRARVRD